jgi:hypothetical protein
MAEIVRGWGEKINFTTTLDEAAARLTIVATRVPTGEIQEVMDAQYYSREGSGPGVGSCFMRKGSAAEEGHQLDPLPFYELQDGVISFIVEPPSPSTVFEEMIRATEDAIRGALRANISVVGASGTSQGHHLHLPMHLPIGNTACTHNAESPHLRCAVNPCGPCEGCPEFEAKP